MTERYDDGICKGCLRGASDCECHLPTDAARAKGYYAVTLPWGRRVVAYWDQRNWWLAGHPHEHETAYFQAIGEMVLGDDE